MAASRNPSFRPVLEALESRAVPSLFSFFPRFRVTAPPPSHTPSLIRSFVVLRPPVPVAQAHLPPVPISAFTASTGFTVPGVGFSAAPPATHTPGEQFLLTIAAKFGVPPIATHITPAL